MKLFKFIGSTLGHVEALVDSVGTTVVVGSDTIGAYAQHQLTIAKESEAIIVATAKLELQEEFDILVEKRNERKANRTVSNVSTDDALSGLL